MFVCTHNALFSSTCLYRLYEIASAKAEAIGVARKAVDSIIAKTAVLADEEHEQRKCFLRVKTRSEVVIKLRINNVGPVVIEPKDTIKIIRKRLQDWIRERGVSEDDLSHLKLAYKGQDLADNVELLNIPMFDPSKVEVTSDFVIPKEMHWNKIQVVYYVWPWRVTWFSVIA